MNIVVLDLHPSYDSRIGRHLGYLVQNNKQVYHIHINKYKEQNSQGFFSLYGEKGYRIDISSDYSYENKILNFFGYTYFNLKIMKDTLIAFKSLNLDNRLPTIIHVHDSPLLILATILIKTYFKNAKIVYDRHEFYENLGFFETLSRKMLSSVIIVSNEHFNTVAKLFPNTTITTVPNFPFTDEYNQDLIKNKIKGFDENSEINLVYIGSLNNNLDRDVNLLLKIAEEILSNHKHVKFIVGGFTNDTHLKEKFHCLSNRFKDKFQYRGIVLRDEAIEILEKSHIGFLLIKPDTSYWVKTSPNKVFEYLICGTIPVIRADVDKSKEISKCSLLFDRYDSDEDIVRETIKLIESPERIRELMATSQKLSNQFTWESVANQYINLYNQLLAGNQE